MNVKGKNILVTGGAGFIGSHLVDEYIGQGAKRVVVFDDFSTGFPQNLHEDNLRLKIVKGSILNHKLLNQTVRNEEIEIVDHEAAELEVYAGISNVQKDAILNITGTLNVLNVAMKNKIEKVLFASSGAVYGEAVYLPVDENHPLVPHWPYGVSKLSAERYCIQYHRLYGLDVTAFRYSIVYGPKEWYGRVLTMFIRRIFIEKKPPVVFGDGKQVRDFVYVEDLVKAHPKAVENPKASGEVFNLSSGRGVLVGELAEMLVKLSGNGHRTMYDNPPEGEASRFQPERIRLKGELKRFILDSSKAKKILGWTTTTSFNEGVLREIEWLRNNKQRWNVKPRV